MNEQTTKLVDQLKDKLLNTSEELVIKMIQEARDEALAEAKALLKERMLQAILESATEDQIQDPEQGQDPENQNQKKKLASSGGTWFQPQPSL